MTAVLVGGWSREKCNLRLVSQRLESFATGPRNYPTFLLPARGDGCFTFVPFPITQTADLTCLVRVVHNLKGQSQGTRSRFPLDCEALG